MFILFLVFLSWSPVISILYFYILPICFLYPSFLLPFYSLSFIFYAINASLLFNPPYILYAPCNIQIFNTPCLYFTICFTFILLNDASPFPKFLLLFNFYRFFSFWHREKTAIKTCPESDKVKQLLYIFPKISPMFYVSPMYYVLLCFNRYFWLYFIKQIYNAR